MPFTETQKIKKIWLFLVLGICILMGSVMGYLVVLNHFDTPLLLGFILLAGIEFFLVFAFLVARLDTEMSTAGIRFRLFPLGWRVIEWQEIQHIEVREYDPLDEYGGWGIRISGAGSAYALSGNTGIQLDLKNGKKILIGTRKADEATTFLRKRELNPLL